MKTIEVELRGPLDENKYSELTAYLKENGEFVSTQRRLFFDLSQIIGINNREMDVRAKVTNDNLQIVVKKGLVGSPSRDEAEVDVKEGSLKETLHLLSLLGYSKGVYGDRRIERYQIGNIEFAIQDVVSVKDGSLYSRFYEAEILTERGNEEKAEKQLRSKLDWLSMIIRVGMNLRLG
jgi:adenylate cyclase class IV